MWQATANIATLFLLLGICLAFVAMTALRLPGTWLLLLTAVAFDWWQQWTSLGWKWLIGLAAIAAAGEAIEMFSSALLASRAGASRQAVWGSVIGGFLGMLFLTFLVPIPFLGTIAGGLVGCFLGAMIAETWARKHFDQAARVGLAATLGFAMGSALKTTLAMLMAGIILSGAWFALRSN